MAPTKHSGVANSVLQYVAVGVLMVVGITGGWILLATNKDANSGVAAQVLAIEKKREYWEEHRPESFRYVLQRRCFCGSDLTSPYLVVERRGLRTAKYIGAHATYDLEKSPLQPVWLDDLFAIASAAVKGKVNVTMSFNEELGFADMVHINPGCMDCDDRYYVSNFEVVE